MVIYKLINNKFMENVYMTEELATYSERGYDYVLNTTDKLKVRSASYNTHRPKTSSCLYATKEMIQAKIKELQECEIEIEIFKQKYLSISQDRIGFSEIELIMQQLADLKRRQSECQEYIAKAKLMTFNNDSLNHVCPLSMVNVSFKGKSINIKIGVPDGVSLDSAFGKAILGKKVGEDFYVEAPAATTLYHIESISPIYF